jgi:PAS domain S-box-containing protein
MFKDKFLTIIVLLSVTSVLVLAAFNVFFLFPSFTALLTEVSENDSVRIATYLGNKILSENISLQRGALPDALKEDGELLRKEFKLMKILIFSPSGETIYSSDPGDVGHVVNKRFFYEVVAKGKVYTEFVKNDARSASGQRVTADVVDTYVPIMKEGKFFGAAEVYMDVTRRRIRNSTLQRESFSALVALGFGLLAAVIIVSLRANKSATARRKAEDALQKSEHFLRTIIETEPECVKLLARDGTVLKMNRAGLAMIEADSFDQVKGQPILALISQDHRQAFERLNQEVFQGKSGTLEFRVTGLKGRGLWLETHAVPLLSERGEIIAALGITRDITAEKQAVAALESEIAERKKAEEEIRKLNEELQRRAKQLEQSFTDLESFSFTASHDLREPLIVIEWFSGNLLKKYGNELDDDGKETLTLIREKAKQMAQLINDLLSFSLISTKEVRKSRIDMEALTKEVFAGMKTAIGGRDVQLEVNDMPAAWGDPAMMRQVLINLLSNALKYTRTRAAARIEAGGSEKESEHIYYVKDNGIGFRNDDLDSLFGLFQRLQSSQEVEGTGVGLAIVKRVVEKHGGRVWAEGKVNEGATFFFSLPPAKSPLST